MLRRTVPFVALAVLAACSSGTRNAPEPAAPRTSRGTDDGAQAQRGVQGRAREDGRGEGRGMGRAREDMLMRGITLSPDQVQRITAIRASYRTQMEQQRDQRGTDRSATRERVESLMEKQQVEVRAVLTAEQQAQFDRNLAEMRERMRGNRRRPGQDARA